MRLKRAKIKIKADPVTHPAHYTSHPSGIECIEIVEHMTFCAGNAVKYAWRAGLKIQPAGTSAASRIEDLKKARWYVDREIQRLGDESLQPSAFSRQPRTRARGAFGPGREREGPSAPDESLRSSVSGQIKTRRERERE